MSNENSNITNTSCFDLHWKSKRIASSLSHVPSTPGLYAFGWDKKCYYGLDAERTYVYIGQTDNLRRRLDQHTPKKETNMRLRKFLLEYYSEARCWYCPLDGIPTTERTKLEVELIQFFVPEFNTHGKQRR